MPTIRVFIALPTPSDIRREITSIQAQLIKSGAEVKWDTPEKFHITLKFLGDTEPALISSIARELQNSIGSFPSFDLSYFSLGGFPNVTRPRVVWVGTQENEHIVHLQEHVERVCTSFGFAKEDRPFHAHITLGRVKGSRNLDRLTAKLKSITFLPLPARCTGIHMMRSELKPTGSVYTLLNSIPLAP
jgi:2'-5' RNA ligase